MDTTQRQWLKSSLLIPRANILTIRIFKENNLATVSNLPLHRRADKGISMHIKEGTNIIFLLTEKTNTSERSQKTAEKQ